MRTGQFGKTIVSLLVPFIISGCASNYNVKLDAIREVQREKAIEEVVEEKIKEEYKKAVYFFTIEALYEDGSKREDRGHGTVVGNEYITVEHWLDFPVIEKMVNGEKKKISLKEVNVSINGRKLDRLVDCGDWNDRGIYKIPKGLSWLENKLEMKEKIELKDGDEVFWWGNPRGIFTETGIPRYCEAKIQFFPKEYDKRVECIGLDRAFIPGDSGSLVVKKKTGEIVGVAAGYVPNKEIGWVIPASSYVRLKENKKFIDNVITVSVPSIKLLFANPPFYPWVSK